MDIAALSVVMANHQVRSNAGLAVMKNAKDMMEQQGAQTIEMLKQPQQPVPHPTIGNQIDVKA
ncbi:putative motility protein [Virgibacillus indicus]|uniref:Putative motility protein n=1 Tax=Virgibacillus indicus TaxID=2024554 RepID=A0A265N8T6_9BACI|nr:YjfB family protein [Virgibacillus indicus]OZU88413.1 putative motility protein [Virgibacillus indicus]